LKKLLLSTCKSGGGVRLFAKSLLESEAALLDVIVDIRAEL